ncbi:hypothetical protein NA57DRAFT_38322 [Rhizodiscina lignyota]|uniref:AB hydrolase-1 domain-containing protein n=1 Tax=Rhizodiscina lignyota TaxID=1504668 RepID=A0A9P4IHY0_9PEZI|nr:hypothetical protein NA57DRAFT_38322 [Rhizodiscina lignyota]
MRVSYVSIVAALLSVVSAKICTNQSVPIHITSRNGLFGHVAVPETNRDATNFTLSLGRQGHNFTNEGLAGYHTISKTYHIMTQYCTPDHPTKKDPAIQILTHGIGFDRTYWDTSYHDFQQSYVNVAVDKFGYYTLSFDRLGIGESSHGDPRDEIQSFLEVQAIRALTICLREGSFPNVHHKFSKIIHTGHSFGSAQTYSLTAMYPDISDGIVLTGFSVNGSFAPSYFDIAGNWVQAALNVPKRLGGYPRGYLVASNTEALEILFLFPGHFPPGLLDLAEETKIPVSIGELLTLGSIPASNPYKGPVLVFTGEHDVPFCGGDCLATGDPSLASIPAAVAKSFPNTKDFEAYIQPQTGHGLTFHNNVTAGYEVIQRFLESKGLKST